MAIATGRRGRRPVRAIKIGDVCDAIHTGIRKSSKTYSDWSLGWTLTDSGVEGLVVAEIAAAIHRRQSKVESLLLEVPYDFCLRWSGARPPRGRRVDTFKGRKRADIVLFNGKGRTKYVIEVKRRLYRKSLLLADLTKLRDVIDKCALQKGGTLKRGFLAVFHQGKTDSVKQWTKDFFDNDRISASVTENTWRKSGRNYSSICIEVYAGA